MCRFAAEQKNSTFKRQEIGLSSADVIQSLIDLFLTYLTKPIRNFQNGLN